MDESLWPRSFHGHHLLAAWAQLLGKGFSLLLAGQACPSQPASTGGPLSTFATPTPLPCRAQPSVSAVSTLGPTGGQVGG